MVRTEWYYSLGFLILTWDNISPNLNLVVEGSMLRAWQRGCPRAYSSLFRVWRILYKSPKSYLPR